MKNSVIVFFALVFVGSGSLSAQSITNYLKKKEKKAIESATKRVDKEVDKSLDKAVNKSLDGLFNAVSKELEDATDSINSTKDTSKPSTENKQSSDERMEAAMGNFMKSMGVGVDVNHKHVFVFSTRMKMLIENTDENGQVDKPIYYTSYFNSDNSDYGIEFMDDNGNQSCFIFDPENHCTLILTQEGDNKNGIATSLGEEDFRQMEAEYSDDERPESFNLKKTGNTKSISGFKCQEYVSEDDRTAVSLWVTQDLKGKINSSIYKSQLFAGTFWMADKADGVLIQYNSRSKITSEHTVMTVKEIDPNISHKINTEGYVITGIALPGTSTK